MMSEPRPTFRTAVMRGLRARCPRCGEGELFQGWNRLRETCSVCGLRYEPRTGDTWFFMYMSTAGMTGALVVIMFLVRPRVLWIGQAVVLVAALVVMLLSLPLRKGVAVALDYLVSRGAET
jgi:uncharacterized protein (DUF983 family)